MFNHKYLLAILFACLTLPTWAAVEQKQREVPLSISTDSVQKIDPPLQAFIQQVWAESPAMQGAHAAIEAALARAEGAGQPLYNPDLAFDVERTAVNAASIGLNQTIDWSNKGVARTRIAEQEIAVAEARLLRAYQLTAIETLNALARYSTEQEMQALAKHRSQLMKDFIKLVKQREEAGDMGALEVTLAQVTYSEALMQQAAIESELAEAKAALQAVTGLDLARWPQLPSELVAPPAHADAKLLQTLPALSVMRSRMAAAKARIKLAKREGRANPTIGIRAGRDDSDFLLGLSLEIPLFVRNNFKAEVRAASHDALSEELAYRDAHRRAKARLDGSLGRFQNTTQAWRAWIANGQQAHQKQMSLLQQMWRAGELTATDYLIQAKQNIDTQAAATTLMGEVWRAAIAWLDASGQVEHWLGITAAESAQKNLER